MLQIAKAYTKESLQRALNRTALYEENKKIAYELFHKYRTKVKDDYEDFEQDCLVYLWQAAATYDENWGAKFSTYAFSTIKQEILNKIRKNNFKKRKGNVYYLDCNINSDDDSIKYEDAFYDESYDAEADLLDKLETKEVVEEVKQKISDDSYRFLLLRAKGYGEVEAAKIILKSKGYSSEDIEKQINDGFKFLRHMKYEIEKIKKGKIEIRRMSL